MLDGERDRTFGEWIEAHKAILFKVARAVAFWVSPTRQAQRERAFGNSLTDEVRRNLALTEYRIAKGRWGATLLWIVPVLTGTLLIYWLTFQVNTDTGLTWWNHALTVFVVAWAISLTAWASDREVKRKL